MASGPGMAQPASGGDVPPPRGALAGVRIVELAGIGPVPFAGMLLADLGADVVRVQRGGPARPGPEVIDRGRRIVEADLKNPAGRDAVLGLIGRAEILLEGFRPGVLERLGLAPERLLGRFPHLVIGRMTGWGQAGPLAPVAGHDINYIALTGALAAVGPDSAPVPPLNLVGDYGGGSLYLVMGVLAALISARAMGSGQVVDAAMCDGAASLMSLFYQLQGAGQWQNRRAANIIDGGAPFYGVYRCADGKFVSVGAIEPAFYALLLDRLGLASDPDFRDQNDTAKWPALKQRLADLFATRTRAEWTSLFEGTDACVAPVLDLAEAPTHPQMVARGTFMAVDGCQVPAPAPRLLGTPSSARASRRDQSIADILAEWTT